MKSYGVAVPRCDVLFLIRSMGRGGAERQLSLLARAMHARGLKVVVAVFYVGGEMELELRAANVPILDLQKTGRWSNLGTARRLLAFVSRCRPQVLHAYLPVQNLFALLLRPFLVRQECAVVCGIRSALPSVWRYSKAGAGVSMLQSALLPHADCVISNSSKGLRLLATRVSKDRGFVIPNGVECQRFVYSAGARARQRAAWNIDTNAQVLGLVGRLDPQKNHKLLLDALRVAGEDMHHVRLVFVGDGPVGYRDEVRAHARALGMDARILWAGPSDDLAAVYSALDVLCLCSVAEGFPNVLAEAMCAGLPCVTTDVGDAAELVGDCGWVVPSGDAQALAQALLQAFDGLADWDREAPRRRMVEHFSVEALADRTLAALAPFLAETPR